MLDQQLILGKTYRLRFKGIFEPHGVCSTTGLTCLHKGNGTFRLEQIASFNDVVLAGIKLYENFFSPVNVSQEEYEAYFSDKPADEYSKEYDVKQVRNSTEQYITQYNPVTGQTEITKKTVTTGKEVFVETGNSVLMKHARDRVNYANYPIYKFVDVQDDTDILYVPELTIDGFPEIEISEYKDLNLVLHLGYFDKPELLDPMLLAIRERMATYGIKPKHIKLYSTGSKWLNPDEYDAIKSIRVPADIDTIPEDAEEADYLHLHIIINGMLKEIVHEVAEGMEDEQVAFSALQSGPVLIDPNLFAETVNPGDKFDELKLYYEQMSDGNWHFMSDIECPAGKEIMQFEAVSSPVAGAKYYQAVEGDFIPFGADEARTGLQTTEDREEYGTEIKANYEKYFWVRTTSTVDTTTTVKWYTATESDVADTSIPLYRKMISAYVDYSDATGTLTHYKSAPRVTGGTGVYKYVNYVKEAALMLIGGTFTYVNDFGQTKTNVLDMADIIDFGMKTKKTTLYYTLGNPSAAEVRAWNEWKGRLFRYKKNYGTDAAPQWVSVEVTIPDTPTTELVGKTGEIIGQKGSISKSLYFVKDTSVRRNYYMQYAILKHKYDVLQDKYNALEKHILAVADK